MCVCVRARARARVCVCVSVSVRACARAWFPDGVIMLQSELFLEYHHPVTLPVTLLDRLRKANGAVPRLSEC